MQRERKSVKIQTSKLYIFGKLPASERFTAMPKTNCRFLSYAGSGRAIEEKAEMIIGTCAYPVRKEDAGVSTRKLNTKG